MVPDGLRRRPQVARHDRARVARARRARARGQDHAAGAVRRHVHGLQPRHVRDQALRGRDQPAAGGDPRGRRARRRGRWCATARSSRATIMELTLSCDHRILYGADAARVPRAHPRVPRARRSGSRSSDVPVERLVDGFACLTRRPATASTGVARGGCAAGRDDLTHWLDRLLDGIRMALGAARGRSGRDDRRRARSRTRSSRAGRAATKCEVLAAARRELALRDPRRASPMTPPPRSRNRSTRVLEPHAVGVAAARSGVGAAIDAAVARRARRGRSCRAPRRPTSVGSRRDRREPQVLPSPIGLPANSSGVIDGNIASSLGGMPSLAVVPADATTSRRTTSAGGGSRHLQARCAPPS